MKKNIFIPISILAAALIAGAFYFMLQDRTSPDVPDLFPRNSGSTAGAEYLNAQRAVDFYREEIRKHPDAVKNYVELAQLFLQESRVTGNHHIYIPKAQHLLDEALLRDPGNYDALVTMGSTLMTQHRFAEAYELAQRAVNIRPYTASGYGVLCDALVEMGYYDRAVIACDKMVSLKPELRAYARVSYLRELHGNIAGAGEAMRLAADAGIAGEENRAWALYMLGTLYLHQGKLDTAAFIYNGILEERPSYPYALSGLAQVKCVKKRYPEAIELLTRAYQTAPEHLFIEQLVDVLHAAGKLQEESGVSKVVQEAFVKHESDGWNINREYAQFCADHDMDLQGALTRAKAEYGVRPENTDVLDTYAWTLYKTGNANDAAPLIERALRLGSKNPSYYYHAGVIFESLGDRKKAQRYLQESISDGLMLNVAYFENAHYILNSIIAASPAQIPNPDGRGSIASSK